MFAKNAFLFAALLGMSLSGFAADKYVNQAGVTDLAAPDCDWGSATFDDACAGFSAKMAAKTARYIAEHAHKSIASQSATNQASLGHSQKDPQLVGLVHLQP